MGNRQEVLPSSHDLSHSGLLTGRERTWTRLTLKDTFGGSESARTKQITFVLRFSLAVQSGVSATVSKPCFDGLVYCTRVAASRNASSSDLILKSLSLAMGTNSAEIS